MKQMIYAGVAILGLFITSAWAQSGKVEVLWLGQSAIKLTTPGGKVIVIDPYLTKNPKTPDQYKDLDALGKVDLVLVTHAHGDHLGDAPEIAKKHNPPLWAPQGLAASLASARHRPSAALEPDGPGRLDHSVRTGRRKSYHGARRA